MPDVVRPVTAPITQAWANGGYKTADGSAQGGHPGTDYGCPSGTKVLACADGTVIFAGPASGFGNHCVSIWHANFGVTSLYGHMGAHNVVVGQNVKAGDEIGTSDNEGDSTGPHLHFEIRPVKAAFGGNPPNIDSEAWLASNGATASKANAGSGTPAADDKSGSGDTKLADGSGIFNGGTWLRIGYFIAGTVLLLVGLDALEIELPGIENVTKAVQKIPGGNKLTSAANAAKIAEVVE